MQTCTARITIAKDRPGPQRGLSDQHQTVLDRFYRANATLVRRTLARLAPDKGQDVVDDMLSDAVLKLVETVAIRGDEKLPTTNREFRAHLLTIARCQLLNGHKSEKRQRLAYQKYGPRQSDYVLPSEDEEKVRARQQAALRWLVETGLDTLSPGQREVIHRMYFLGETRSQVAVALGIADKTVAAHRDRAMRRLQAVIESARSDDHDLQHWHAAIRALKARKRQAQRARRQAERAA